MPSPAEVIEKENEVSVSFLNIQVGLIRKSWKHPSADRSFDKLSEKTFINIKKC